VISAGTLNCGPETVPAGTTQAASTFTVHITSPTTRATGGTCPVGSGVIDNTGTVDSTNAGSEQSSANTCVQKGTFRPRPKACTALLVRPKQLFVNQQTTVHIKVTNGRRPVAGVRVSIAGAGLSFLTRPSNAKGWITRTIKPSRGGIVFFRTKATRACNVSLRVGAIKGNIDLTG
jgi:hypothetical protein